MYNININIYIYIYPPLGKMVVWGTQNKKIYIYSKIQKEKNDLRIKELW